MSAPLCTEIEARLPDYLAGALPAAEQARIDAHLAACPACREMADTLRLLQDAMQTHALPETLDETRRAAVRAHFRRRADRKTVAMRWSELLEWFNPARAPHPAFRLAVAALVFVALPVLMIALLQRDRFADQQRRFEAQAEPMSLPALDAPSATGESAVYSLERPESDVATLGLSASTVEVGKDEQETLYRRLATVGGALPPAPTRPAEPNWDSAIEGKKQRLGGQAGDRYEVNGAVSQLFVDAVKDKEKAAESKTEEMVPLVTTFPKPVFVGTPVNLNVPHLEKPENAPVITVAGSAAALPKPEDGPGSGRLQAPASGPVPAPAAPPMAVAGKAVGEKKSEQANAAGLRFGSGTLVSAGALSLDTGRLDADGDSDFLGDDGRVSEVPASRADTRSYARERSSPAVPKGAAPADPAANEESLLKSVRLNWYDYDDRHGGMADELVVMETARLRTEDEEKSERESRRKDGPDSPEDALRRRLEQTMIPEFDFREAKLADISKFLEKTLAEAAPTEKPVPVDASAVTDENGRPPTVTLSLRRVSALNALKYVTEVADSKFRFDGDKVIIEPQNASVAGRVVTRLYPVQPALLDAAGSPTDAALTNFFANVGVPFPVGTSIHYDGTLGRLVVANTPENLEHFDNILANLDVSTNTAARAPAGFNPYVETKRDAVSTFSIDVDTASYALTRQALEQGRLPDPEEVRTEEIVNAFDYDYAPPAAGAFSVHTALAPSPFRAPLDLLQIGMQGRVLGRDAQRPAVLTLVVDGSGSMDTADRLGRIRAALRLLADRLQPGDSVALVQFSEQPRLLLDRTSGTNRAALLAAMDALSAAGSTDLEAGLRLGYEVAARGFRSGAANRVILLSDGVANLGAGRADAILASVAQHRRQGIYLAGLRSRPLRRRHAGAAGRPGRRAVRLRRQRCRGPPAAGGPVGADAARHRA